MSEKITKHPRDQYITVYGRKPVLEALRDREIEIDKVLVANNVQGEIIDEIIEQAQQRGLKVKRESQQYVTRISRNGRHDQGVVLDAIAPEMESLATYLEREPPHYLNGQGRKFLALDGVKNPSNVGLIIRNCLASGFDGVILPRKGCPDISPLVLKASAGTAFQARILRCPSLPEALEQLQNAGYAIYGLDSQAPQTLYNTSFAPLSVFVLGNETEGLSEETQALVHCWVSIPMSDRIESLNVACAAAVVCFEIRRQQLE
jgi:23S rRNA (guanosine2251-2'-O)-methyltransferase